MKRRADTSHVGKHNCIGKHLALDEVRSVVALLVSHFDISYAPGEDGTTVWRDLKDQFNAHPGSLHLIFSQREMQAGGQEQL